MLDGQVTVPVVHVLEEVDVEHRERHRRSAARARQFAIEHVHDRAAIE
jgi:hypothetical protein